MEGKVENENDQYQLRRYEPGDEEGFVDLYEAVWGHDRSVEWFEWKYVDNPYADEVAMVVAESDDGKIVGTRPFVTLPMRSDDELRTALLTTDTMVHPDHRRRGLFTRMTERSIDRYAEREPAFVFNQPNSSSRPGYREMGWREVDPMVTHYRVQHPSRLLEARDVGVGDESGRLADLAEVAPHVLRGYDRVRSAVTPDSDYEVRRHDEVLADRLAALYRRRIPDEIHAHREAKFYRWRFDSPEWDQSTYVVRGETDDVCAAVVRTRINHGGVTITQIADVAPLAGDGRWEEALSALAEAVVSDHPDSDVIVAPDRGFPAEVLRPLGFLPDDTPPVSMVAETDCALMARSLDGSGGWRMNERPLADPASWRLTFAERDTA